MVSKLLHKFLIIVFIPLLLATCSGPSTQALLDADFITGGRSGVKLSTPGNGVTLFDEANLIFGWQDIPGVGRYIIEAADTADFSNIVISKSVTKNEYVFQRGDLKTGATYDSTTFYWRVSVPSNKNNLRSDVWAASLIAENHFFVDCAYTGTSYGTRSAPLKTMQAGLDSALGSSLLALTTASAEVRVAKGTCSETITLRPNVALKGGYDPTQNWLRNPALYQTILSTTNAVAVQGFGDLTSAYPKTLMEGFKVQTTNTGANISNSVYLISSVVTFRNNYFVYSTATAQAGVGLAPMFVSRGSITVDSNIFSAFTASSTSGHILAVIYFEGATLTATNNIFYENANAGGISSKLIYGDITADANSTFNATNNVFFLVTSSGNTLGTLMELTQGGSGTFSGTVERNVFYMLGAPNSNRCAKQNASAKLTTLKNNALVDCHQNSTGFWAAPTNLGTGYVGGWSALANAATTGGDINTGLGFANGTPANNPVNCTGACAALSGNRGGNTKPSAVVPVLPGDPAVVFQGYVAGDPTTFAFKPNTIADMDSNGAYDATIDAGANAATAGLVALR